MIWCVEDDAGVRDMELYTLRSVGMEAEGFSDAAALFDAMAKEIPDLILLDIMMPGADGVAVLARLRQDPRTREVPVVMATARGTEYDKVRCLDMGADDYLVKPFGMMEMVSRIRAVLRRSGHTDTGALTSGTLTLNPVEHTVVSDGERVALTYKEFELLKLFLGHPGRVYNREELFSMVWGADYIGESRTVDMHIRTLRRKLGAHGKRIVTVRHVGYRWEAAE